MNEYENSKVYIDDTVIRTRKAVFVSCNMIEAEVGTTGYCGGDTGHGGRTYFKLQDLSSTDMRVRVNGGELVSLMSEGAVEIMFGGDCELDTFIEVLEFAVKTLKEQCSTR